MSPKREAFQPNLYVVARFLDALSRPDVALSRAQLQAAVGVNYDIFRRYLVFLESNGYLVADETVRLSADGRRVREELRSWLDRFLRPEPGERSHNATADRSPTTPADLS